MIMSNSYLSITQIYDILIMIVKVLEGRTKSLPCSSDDGPQEPHEGRDGSHHRQPGQSPRQLVALLGLFLLEHQAEGVELGGGETLRWGRTLAEGAGTKLTEEVDPLAEHPGVGGFGKRENRLSNSSGASSGSSCL